MPNECSFQKLTENYLILLFLLQQACSIIWLHSQPETSHFQLKYACGLSAATWYGMIQIHTHMCIYLKKKKTKDHCMWKASRTVPRVSRRKRFKNCWGSFFLSCVNVWMTWMILQRKWRCNTGKGWRGGACSGQNKEIQDHEWHNEMISLMDSEGLGGTRQELKSTACSWRRNHFPPSVFPKDVTTHLLWSHSSARKMGCVYLWRSVHVRIDRPPVNQ